ncbi:pre-rRNA processing [Lecanora helva]
MEFEVSYTLDNEQQFWDELDEIVSAECCSHQLIDNALRSYLTFTTDYKGEYIKTEHDIARCSYRLLESSLFTAHKDYVRQQIVCSVLQEDSPDALHTIISFLLLDGRQNEATYEMMSEEGVFPRLLELINGRVDDDAGLHRTLLEVLYEMSRIQRVRILDLVSIEDEFIEYMFQIIEGLSDDVNDPYHYPVIRILLILNEQYMVSAHDPSPVLSHPSVSPLTNKVIKILSTHGSSYKTFGENIILLLNRESETSLQLLILKLLYLVFTTPSTYEYFYTNDLYVLLDIILRNLLDLPPSSTALRHTYLRVLYPLLAHTQLKHPPHYKQNELIRLLSTMAEDDNDHFGAVDETTKRLVGRCVRVDWLKQEEGGDPGSPIKMKQRLLSVSMPSTTESSLSVGEVAAQTSKPGVQTPSRAEGGGGSENKGEANNDRRNNGLDVRVVEESGGDDSTTNNGWQSKAVDVPKSPFEAEGDV